MDSKFEPEKAKSGESTKATKLYLGVSQHGCGEFGSFREGNIYLQFDWKNHYLIALGKAQKRQSFTCRVTVSRGISLVSGGKTFIYN
jgi:hypothetical protein